VLCSWYGKTIWRDGTEQYEEAKAPAQDQKAFGGEASHVGRPQSPITYMKAALRKTGGVALIIVGAGLHLIPLFPAGWIIVLGLELVGIHLLLPERFRRLCRRFRGK
jgi:hypothetical protein